jgi:hypothetical protein
VGSRGRRGQLDRGCADDALAPLGNPPRDTSGPTPDEDVQQQSAATASDGNDRGRPLHDD